MTEHSEGKSSVGGSVKVATNSRAVSSGLRNFPNHLKVQFHWRRSSRDTNQNATIKNDNSGTAFGSDGSDERYRVRC